MKERRRRKKKKKKKKKEDEQNRIFQVWFSRLLLNVSGVFRVDLAIE